MLCILLFLAACSQEHSHDDLSQRVVQLEKKIAMQELTLQKIRSTEVLKKKISPLCISEQTDVYVISKKKFDKFGL